MATRTKRPIDATARQGTTLERLRKANGNVHVQNGVQYMRDGMLDRALNRRRIDSRQYAAGEKYRLHWYHSGLEGLTTVDLNGVRSVVDFSHMPKTEQQAFHRQRYRLARAELERVNCLDPIERFVLRDISIADIAFGKAAWKQRGQAQAAMLTTIQFGLNVLAAHFGI